MKFAIAPVLLGIFAVLGAFGFNVSEDVKAAVLENADYVVNGIFGLLAAYALYKSKQPKPAPGPDEHADVSKSQGGFIRLPMLAMLAGVMLVFAAGCASFGSGQQLSPDQRAAAALVDAKAIANTCADLYERDRIGEGDAQTCYIFVSQAIEMAGAAHFLIVTGDTPEEQSKALEYLSQAEQLITALQQVLVKLEAEDKPASTQVALRNSVLPLGSFDSLVKVLA